MSLNVDFGLETKFKSI